MIQLPHVSQSPPPPQHLPQGMPPQAFQGHDRPGPMHDHSASHLPREGAGHHAAFPILEANLPMTSNGKVKTLYDGYTLTLRRRPAGEGKMSWADVEIVQMTVSPESLGGKVEKNEKQLKKQLNEVKKHPNQEQLVRQLLNRRNHAEQDPRFEWEAAMVKIDKKLLKSGGMTASMQLILRRIRKEVPFGERNIRISMAQPNTFMPAGRTDHAPRPARHPQHDMPHMEQPGHGTPRIHHNASPNQGFGEIPHGAHGQPHPHGLNHQQGQHHQMDRPAHNFPPQPQHPPEHHTQQHPVHAPNPGGYGDGMQDRPPHYDRPLPTQNHQASGARHGGNDREDSIGGQDRQPQRGRPLPTQNHQANGARHGGNDREDSIGGRGAHPPVHRNFDDDEDAGEDYDSDHHRGFQEDKKDVRRGPIHATADVRLPKGMQAARSPTSSSFDHRPTSRKTKHGSREMHGKLRRMTAPTRRDKVDNWRGPESESSSSDDDPVFDRLSSDNDTVQTSRSGNSSRDTGYYRDSDRSHQSHERRRRHGSSHQHGTKPSIRQHHRRRSSHAKDRRPSDRASADAQLPLVNALVANLVRLNLGGAPPAADRWPPVSPSGPYPYDDDHHRGFQRAAEPPLPIARGGAPYSAYPARAERRFSGSYDAAASPRPVGFRRDSIGGVAPPHRDYYAPDDHSYPHRGERVEGGRPERFDGRENFYHAEPVEARRYSDIRDLPRGVRPHHQRAYSSGLRDFGGR